jgi:hypothetical protein
MESNGKTGGGRDQGAPCRCKRKVSEAAAFDQRAEDTGTCAHGRLGNRRKRFRDRSGDPEYRVVAPDGHSLGGPFYYIEQGMGKNWKWLAKLFAFFGVCVGLFGIGTFSQVNGIASAINGFFDPDNAHCVKILPFLGEYSWSVVIASLILTVCVAAVLIGGVKRIASVSQIVYGDPLFCFCRYPDHLQYY